VLQAVLPEHDGPTAVVPVEMGDAGLEERDGIEAKTVVLQQLRAALDILRDHNPARISTLGGECSVSMAPFSYLINKYGDDMAILWIDSHPDMGTGETLDPNSIRTHWCRPAVEAVLEQRTGQLPGDHRDRHRDRASARPHGVLTNSDDATAGPVG
jgi:arginase family enzyme